MTSNTEPALGVVFERVDKRYEGVLALARLSLSIVPGEFVALLGPNGSGKTTLLRTAALLLRPSAGRVYHPGAEGRPAEEVRRYIGLVAHLALVYDELTARENLALFARLYELTEPTEHIEKALDAAGLAPRGNDLAATFSRGMRQRLAIARALLTGPRLVLFDEPATGLDRQGREWLERTLDGLRRTGATLIVSTHDDWLASLASRSVWLEAGRVAQDSGARAESRAARQVRG
jgi:ABC-type multidrug transport system ATPase subunit